MEHSWSRADANSGNRRQTQSRRTPLAYLLSSAIACPYLPRLLHGKEGVDGSSPSEGFDGVAVSASDSRSTTSNNEVLRRARDCIERRLAEGKSTRDATRPLKRYVARHVYRLLEQQPQMT